ncbi:TlpA family protein disulfide reductase [Ochrovirga pacifica]|uniref:TlpA family protein disulfide reductase n=1 Tax=Ochrovirga pacifica TaxID=1042376 RepID=UPI0002557F7B|nr:TlpA disulfide reductase family protein [Ochrovirga pacifica]
MNIIQSILITSTALLTFACSTSSASAIEVNIKNLPEHIDQITIQSEKQVKTITKTDGKFKDTINFNQDFVLMRVGTFATMLFLDKDTDLTIYADADNFNQSLQFNGKGAKENKYINLRDQITQKIFTSLDSINHLDSADFKAYHQATEKKIENLLVEYDGMNDFLASSEKKNLEQFMEGLEQQYFAANREVTDTEVGKPSPEFNDLENYKGGTTSLKDLRGNYVYIDVWATWCMPCLQQIPFLQKLEEKFHGKDIKFVSLSIDNPNAKDKWKQMISDKNMGGIQLFANGNIPFVQDYQITGIPRFILLDKEGNIVDANAPRPSQPELEKILADLLK